MPWSQSVVEIFAFFLAKELPEPLPSKDGPRGSTKLETFKSELKAFLSELEAYGPVR